jgi:hypothetical protein
MNRWRVGEDRGSKETDRCPLTATYCCCSFSITGSGIDQNSLEVFRGHSYSPRNSLGIP